jgi:hypothetical protein
MTGSSTFMAADGDGYELQMGRWSRRLAEPFLDAVGTVNGECVLDVGCGTGRLTFALAERCQVGLPPKAGPGSSLVDAPGWLLLCPVSLC